MAILQIQISNSKFTSHNGVNVEKFTDKSVEGNGWECQITEDGKVFCVATYSYKGVEQKIKFTIKNGYAKLKRKVGNSQEKRVRSYKINQKSTDGFIRLSNDFTNLRCAYFREINFQKFLDDHGLTSVRYESVNGIYTIFQKNDGENIVFEECIESDGTIELIFNDITTCTDESFVIERRVQITNATWVIKNVMKMGKIQHRILYTRESPEKIIGLPQA